jgi:hypothetical protein
MGKGQRGTNTLPELQLTASSSEIVSQDTTSRKHIYATSSKEDIHVDDIPIWIVATTYFSFCVLIVFGKYPFLTSWPYARYCRKSNETIIIFSSSNTCIIIINSLGWILSNQQRFRYFLPSKTLL